MNIRTVELNFDKKEDGLSITDITRQVEHSIIETKINNGMVTVFVESPHTSVSTMEFEPGMISDVKNAIKKLMPNGDEHHYGLGGANLMNGANGHSGGSNGHSNGNSNGHSEACDPLHSLIGPSITLPFKDNRLMLGKWQEIVLLDFASDRARRKVILQIIGDEMQHIQ